MPVGMPQLIGASIATLFLVAAADAGACASVDSGPSRAWPPNGSKDVSPATSVFVLGSTVSNDDITLTANGAPVELAFTEMGRLYLSSGKVFRANLPDLLEPSTEYVLTGPAKFGPTESGDAGAPVELTRFTTAASYDKIPGTPPSISSLELWSVRYPVSDIGSGNCVFSEYQGYARVKFTPAQIPSTTPEGTLYTLTITPRTAGAAQSLLFSGDNPFAGHDLSADPYPLSLPAEWFLDLDPRREYCATLSARGDGDNARLPVVSEPACAPVSELCAKGAECSGDDAPDDGGACTTARGAHSSRLPPPLWLAAMLALIWRARRRRAGGVRAMSWRFS